MNRRKENNFANGKNKRIFLELVKIVHSEPLQTFMSWKMGSFQMQEIILLS